MNSTRPAARRVLSCCLAPWRSSAAPLPLPATSHSSSSSSSFHSSAPLGKRKPRFKNVRAAEMGLVTPEKIDQFAKRKFPEYTAEEKKILSERYTKEQMEALEAGEAAIDPHDLAIQGRIRTDQYRLPYIDDFSTIQPVIDKRAAKKPSPMDTEIEFQDIEEFGDRFMNPQKGKMTDEQLKQRYGLQVPKLYELTRDETDKLGADDLPYAQFFGEESILKGAADSGNTALAPGLGDIAGVRGLYLRQIDPEDGGMDDEGKYETVKKRTGLKMSEIMSISTKVITRRIVANQTRLGKIRRYAYIAIAGNGSGRLGLGFAKSTESGTAQENARRNAILNMRPIRRYENRTIYGNVRQKISGTVVELMSRPPGFGLRVPSRIFDMCRLAGITDLACRMPRSRSPMNTVKAAYHALLTQPDPNEIAIGRGKKMVDVRKVYYGGAVY